MHCAADARVICPDESPQFLFPLYCGQVNHARNIGFDIVFQMRQKLGGRSNNIDVLQITLAINIHVIIKCSAWRFNRGSSYSGLHFVSFALKLTASPLRLAAGIVVSKSVRFVMKS